MVNESFLSYLSQAYKMGQQLDNVSFDRLLETIPSMQDEERQMLTFAFVAGATRNEIGFYNLWNELRERIEGRQKSHLPTRHCPTVLKILKHSNVRMDTVQTGRISDHRPLWKFNLN